MKITTKIAAFLLAFFMLLTDFSFVSQGVSAATNDSSNQETITLSGEVPSKMELINEGVDESKVDTLIEKMENGEDLDADKYFEEQNEDVTLATIEDPHYRKDFADGSFIENTITDVTEEENAFKNKFALRSIKQVGGTSEYRTLEIKSVKPWGTMRYRVKIYFPMIGYSKILQAYDWYYIGTVYSTEYKGIYRASETATQDAVAIYKLQIEVLGNSGGRYLVKTEFRIRDGRYWTVYKN